MCPGALITQTVVMNWDIIFWKQENLDVLNNKILQTDDEGQL